MTMPITAASTLLAKMLGESETRINRQLKRKPRQP